MEAIASRLEAIATSNKKLYTRLQAIAIFDVKCSTVKTHLLEFEASSALHKQCGRSMSLCESTGFAPTTSQTAEKSVPQACTGHVH